MYVCCGIDLLTFPPCVGTAELDTMVVSKVGSRGSRELGAIIIYRRTKVVSAATQVHVRSQRS